MNRITRCPACDSVYWVNDELLNVAGGWLRCGQCQHIFDSTGFVLNWAAPSGAGKPASDQHESRLPSDPALMDDGERIVIDDLLKCEDRSAPVKQSPASDDLSSFEAALSTFRPKLDGLPITPSNASQETAVANPPSLAENPDAPLYIVRWGKAVLLALLSICLALQLLFIQRHLVGQHWPVFESLLQNICAQMSCKLAPRQHLEGLVIESSSLVRRPENFVLSWVIRNTTNSTVGMTALELTLLEASDKPVLRKVFWPDHVGAPAQLSPGQVWAGELILRANPELIFSDYRILSFYP